VLHNKAFRTGELIGLWWHHHDVQGLVYEILSVVVFINADFLGIKRPGRGRS
jgi:hypothetical protein